MSEIGIIEPIEENIACDDNRGYDIGNYIGRSINTLTKKKLLLDAWKPSKNYSFPYSEHNKKGKLEKRYAGKKYLEKFEWLVWSDVKQGYFCKYCSLLANSGLGGF